MGVGHSKCALNRSYNCCCHLVVSLSARTALSNKVRASENNRKTRQRPPLPRGRSSRGSDRDPPPTEKEFQGLRQRPPLPRGRNSRGSELTGTAVVRDGNYSVILSFAFMKNFPIPGWHSEQ